MRISIFILFILFFGEKELTSRANKTFDVDFQGVKYLPVYISYNYSTKEPPDSIKEFFKEAFQNKKIKVIRKEELENLIRLESERVFSIARSNGFSDGQSLMDQVDRLTEPVCNSLQIKFALLKEQNGFSLQWRTYTHPVNPLKTIIGDWIPINTDNIKEMPYRNSIAAVVDSILDSRKLQ